MLSLVDGNIRLRALEPEDIKILSDWENNPENWLYSQQQLPLSQHILRSYLANAHQDIYEAKQLRLVIEAQNKAVGLADLFDFDFNNRRAGVGILIGERINRNKGLAKSALKILISYAQKAFDLKQLHASVGSNNTASLKLFESLGFKKVGERRAWFRHGDDYENEVLLQLIFDR